MVWSSILVQKCSPYIHLITATSVIWWRDSLTRQIMTRSDENALHNIKARENDENTPKTIFSIHFVTPSSQFFIFTPSSQFFIFTPSSQFFFPIQPNAAQNRNQQQQQNENACKVLTAKPMSSCTPLFQASHFFSKIKFSLLWDGRKNSSQFFNKVMKEWSILSSCFLQQNNTTSQQAVTHQTNPKHQWNNLDPQANSLCLAFIIRAIMPTR